MSTKFPKEQIENGCQNEIGINLCPGYPVMREKESLSDGVRAI